MLPMDMAWVGPLGVGMAWTPGATAEHLCRQLTDGMAGHTWTWNNMMRIRRRSLEACGGGDLACERSGARGGAAMIGEGWQIP
jgi:hypothetical protein